MAARKTCKPDPAASGTAGSKPPTRQFVLRLPEDLAQRLDALSADTGASRNSLLVEALRLTLDQPAARLVIATRAEDQRTARHRDKPQP